MFLIGAGIAMLGLNAVASNVIVGYYASALAALMMVAVALPSRRG